MLTKLSAAQCIHLHSEGRCRTVALFWISLHWTFIVCSCCLLTLCVAGSCFNRKSRLLADPRWLRLKICFTISGTTVIANVDARRHETPFSLASNLQCDTMNFGVFGSIVGLIPRLIRFLIHSFARAHNRLFTPPLWVDHKKHAMSWSHPTSCPFSDFPYPIGRKYAQVMEPQTCLWLHNRLPLLSQCLGVQPILHRFPSKSNSLWNQFLFGVMCWGNSISQSNTAAWEIQF